MASRSKPSLTTLRRRHERRLRRRAWTKRVGRACVGILVAILVFPAIQRLGYANRERRAIEKRIAELQGKHDSLAAQVAERRLYRDYAETAEAQEATARHYGFHRQGEQVYLVTSDKP